MLYLELVLVFITVILWLIAPKIILKPRLSGHSYDIRFYVARFRRHLLTTTILIEILVSPLSPFFANSYLTLISSVFVLIFSTAFLVEFRGQSIKSAWGEGVIFPWQMFLTGRWVCLGVTGLLALYLNKIHVDTRFIAGLLVCYLLWAITPIVFMLLRKALLDLSSLVPRPEATGIGCAVQVGALCVTVIVGVCLWLPWFLILYMYLVLAYLGALVVEVLNFVGDL